MISRVLLCVAAAALAAFAQTAPNLFTEIRRDGGKVELVMRNDHTAAVEAFRVNVLYENFGGRVNRGGTNTGGDVLLTGQKGLAPRESLTVALTEVPMSVRIGVIYVDGLTAGSIEVVAGILTSRRQIRDAMPGQIEALRVAAGKSASVDELARQFRLPSALPASLLEDGAIQATLLVRRVLREVIDSGEPLTMNQTVDRVALKLTDAARSLMTL